MSEQQAAPARLHDEPLLVVDLDGTLIRTDLLVESLVRLFHDEPLVFFFRVPVWLARGRAVLKRELARRVDLHVDRLPYQEALLDMLRAQRERGRKLVLVSASDESLVGEVAAHLALFDHWIGSDGAVNLKGPRKRERLVAEYGERGFDYAGDSRADLPVWAAARRGLVASASRLLRARAARRTEVVASPVVARRSPLAYLRLLRGHHWIKNLLIFVPILAAQRIDELALVRDLAIGFASFCLLTSGLYVFNDLLDLDADRRHPRKRERPLASGAVAPLHGVVMVPILIGAAFLLSWQLAPAFLPFLATYFALTLAYSLKIKQVVLLDVIVLASLFMLRILAGGGPVGIPLSRWLLGCSMFLFLSLALLKRYTEITTMRAAAGKPTTVRGYRSRDAELILALGSASGYLSVVVFALYVETATATRLYTHNELLWLVCPVLLYWISYLWLMAHRNRMPYDPLVFAVRHRTSRLLGLIMAGLILLAL